MKRYEKIIFLCTNNTYLSPIAEAMYRHCTMAEENMPGCCSRGLVVLFSEPISPKVNIALMTHDMEVSSHENSQQFQTEELTEDVLILTMTFSEKVKLLEEYPVENVYTLGEFVGEDTDIIDPYGGEEEQYERCYEDILRRIKKTVEILKKEISEEEETLAEDA